MGNALYNAVEKILGICNESGSPKNRIARIHDVAFNAIITNELPKIELGKEDEGGKEEG